MLDLSHISIAIGDVYEDSLAYFEVVAIGNLVHIKYTPKGGNFQPIESTYKVRGMQELIYDGYMKLVGIGILRGCSDTECTHEYEVRHLFSSSYQVCRKCGVEC